jgi:hypothetical protein
VATPANNPVPANAKSQPIVISFPLFLEALAPVSVEIEK